MLSWRPGSAATRRPQRRAPRLQPPRRPPPPNWMTGITLGPPDWELHHHHQQQPHQHGTHHNQPEELEQEQHGESRQGQQQQQRLGQRQGRRSRPAAALAGRYGLTLYASHYRARGIVAFDGTTLLPLGTFLSYSRVDEQRPEGICSSRDALYVLSVDCVVTRVVRDAGNPRKGVVAARVRLDGGWVGWGMALGPAPGAGDLYGNQYGGHRAKALYCAVDLMHGSCSSHYTRLPMSEECTGGVVCVPLELLATQGGQQRQQEGGSSEKGHGQVQGPTPPGQQQPEQQQQQQQQQQLLPEQLVHAGEAGPSAGSGEQAPQQPNSPWCFANCVVRRPSGVCFDPYGNLWVTSYEGAVLQLAGPGHPQEGRVLHRVLLPPRPDAAQQAAVQGGSNGEGGTCTAAAALHEQQPGVSGSGGRLAGGGGEGRMMAWDVCVVPVVGWDGRSRRGCGGGQVDVRGQGAAAWGNQQGGGGAGEGYLLCVTSHENSSTPRKGGGEECRVAVMRVGGEANGRGQGGGAEAEAEAEAAVKGGGQKVAEGQPGGELGETGRFTVARCWPAHMHSHTNMACVC